MCNICPKEICVDNSMYLYYTTSFHIHPPCFNIKRYAGSSLEFSIDSDGHRKFKNYLSLGACLDAVPEYVELTLEEILDFLKFKKKALAKEGYDGVPIQE